MIPKLSATETTAADQFYGSNAMQEMAALLSCQENEYVVVNQTGVLEKRESKTAFVFLFHLQKYFHQWMQRKKIHAAINRIYAVVTATASKNDAEQAIKSKVRAIFFQALHSKSKGLPDLHLAVYEHELAVRPLSLDTLAKLLDETSVFEPTPGADPAKNAAAKQRFLIYKRFGFNSEQLDRTLQKLIRLNAAIKNKTTISTKDRLTLADLKMIHGAQFITDRYSIPDLMTCSEDLKKIALISKEFDPRSPLARVFNSGYRTGDVLFYDLKTKQEMGDAGSWWHAQYARHGHVGVLLKNQTHTDLSPDGLTLRTRNFEVMHFVEELKINDLSKTPIRMVFLQKRSIDFSKVFKNYKKLSRTEKNELKKIYRSHIEKEFKANDPSAAGSPLPEKYGALKQAGVDSTLWEIIKRYLQIFSRRTPVAQPKKIEREMNKTADAVNKLMCSGLVGAVVFESLEKTMQEWNASHPEKAIEFRSEIVQEVTDMTPRDLKRWNIWKKTDPKEMLRYRRIFDAEVLSGYEAIAVK